MEEKLKIATHDSATGEKGYGFLSCIVTPFAKTQSKTIKEQYDKGCRLFDIRVKYRNHVLVCAHGLWTSEKWAYEIFSELNSFEERCFVSITYEGRVEDIEEFIGWCDIIHEDCKNLTFGYVASKYGKDSDGIKVKYDILKWYDKENFPKNEQAFLPLDGRSWHTYLPIPWLWKKFYFNNVVFNTEVYKYVDFL